MVWSLGICQDGVLLIMNNEKWLDVVGFEGKYMVSNTGRVRSLTRIVPHKNGRPATRREGKILSQGIASHGYPTVSLCRETRTVHSLVLKAFTGPRPSSRHEARHIDGDRENTSLDNLVWGTFEENQKDKIKHGTTNRGRSRKLTVDDVLEIRKIVAGKKYGKPTYTEIGGMFGIGGPAAYMIGNKKSWAWLT